MSTFHLILDPYASRTLAVCPDPSNPTKQAASLDVRKLTDLATQVETAGHALNAEELSEFLSVSTLLVYKLARSGRLPSFKVGTCVRFDPRAVAQWLRRM